MGTFDNGTRVQGGTLAISGALDTPTIALAKRPRCVSMACCPTATSRRTQLSGVGQNSVIVGAAGLAYVHGDLGDGNDLLDVAGRLDTGSGTLSLGSGDDLFVVEDGAQIRGVIDAGDGEDTLQTDIATQASLGSVARFDALLKTGAGVLDVEGAVPSAFAAVNVQGGLLHVAASAACVDVAQLTVAQGATLHVDGLVAGSDGRDLMDVGGRIEGAGSDRPACGR
jgi:fibronectin-binding autotransporter adhesin